MDASSTQTQPAATGRLVYLDNAATSYPKPEPVVRAVQASLEHSLTVARSTHLAPFRGDEVLKRCRVKLARFFGAARPEEMVYTYSATDGLNIVLSGVIKPGGHVLVTPLEHHSVMRPLHHMRAASGVSWTELPADVNGIVDVAAIRELVRPDTCAIVINWASNVSGTMQPVADIGAVARELGLPYIIDAAQATGTHAVDVAAIGCDAMAQPAHKALMSLPGMGVLYIRDGFDCRPWRVGGTGYRSDLVMQPEERPVRFESGTVNVPGVVGLDAAMDWFAATGLQAIHDHGMGLTTRLLAGLADIPRVRLIGPPADMERAFVVSFIVDDSTGAPIDPLVFSQALAEGHGVSSRAGLHCAPTAHRHFGTYDRGGTVRFSINYFTTPEEIDYALEAVTQVVRGW